MRSYSRVLSAVDFRRLWLGSTVSTLGDGMTFVVLSWLVLSRPNGTVELGLLGVCYTAPVLLGGLAVGPLLDRFDKRTVLIADCLLRAAVVASVPVTAAAGAVPAWLPFVVAAIHGLLKMVPLAGFPAAIPNLVDESDLDAANALESLSFSAAGVAGPALAGFLIDLIGPVNVLLVDCASFLAFAVAAALVRTRLRPVSAGTTPVAAPRAGVGRLVRDRVILGTTVAFMMFNIAEGMLLVAGPWLARTQLPGGPAALGILLAAMAAGEFVGATLAGNRRGPRRHPVRVIGLLQTAAACAFLGVLATPNEILVGAAFFGIGMLSAPMTVLAQSLRMRRVPPELHGRTFALLRTLMQATPPLGSLLVTPLLAAGNVIAAVVAMAFVAGLPGLLLALRGDAEPEMVAQVTAPA